jgi:CRISPR system Cascade subunit CasB
MSLSSQTKDEAPELFVAELRQLGRGELAELRRAAGTTLGQHGQATAIFYRMLPPESEGFLHREAAFLAATLYPLNPKGSEGDLGQSLRMLAPALDRRVAILLESRLDWREGGGGELPYRLRQLVRLLASKGIGIDWVQLVRDLGNWNDDRRIVQRRWAESYFRKTVQNVPQQTDTGGDQDVD